MPRFRIVFLRSLSILVTVAFAAVSYAQNTPRAAAPSGTKTVPEPEYAFVVAVVDVDGSKLIDLERKTPQVVTKIKKLGFGGGESGLVLQGERASVRFPEGRSIDLVIRVESRSVDPHQQIQFFRWMVKDGHRYLVMAKASLFRGGETTQNESAIEFTAEKYGESSFVFRPIEPLSPGEYCVSSPKTDDAFSFGVDPTSDKQQQ